jgi:hypothetical protein
MHQLTDSPARPGIDTRTRVGLACLVVGTVLLALGRLLGTKGGSPADRLQQMSGNDARVTAGSVIAIIGFCALIPGFLAVANLVRDRGRVIATVGSGLVVVGSVCFAVLAAVDLSTLAATHVADAAAMEDYLHELDVAPGILLLTPLAVAGYFLGPFLVTLGARRGGLVARWLPWGVLASLIVQPIGLGLGGPGLAQVVDGLCQLALVAMVTVLVRSVVDDGARQ